MPELVCGLDVCGAFQRAMNKQQNLLYLHQSCQPDRVQLCKALPIFAPCNGGTLWRIQEKSDHMDWWARAACTALHPCQHHSRGVA